MWVYMQEVGWIYLWEVVMITVSGMACGAAAAILVFAHQVWKHRDGA